MDKWFVTETNNFNQQVPEIWCNIFNNEEEAIKAILIYMEQSDLLDDEITKEVVEKELSEEGYIILGDNDLIFTIQSIYFG